MTTPLFHYTPPEIRTLMDVLPHIEGEDSIKVMQRDALTIIDYVVAKPDTHPAIMSDDPDDKDSLTAKMRRECRGLIFDQNGFIISRPFEKFHNIGEKDWTQPHMLDERNIVRYMAKEDGSMVRPIWMDNGFRLATRKGITDVSMQAELMTITSMAPDQRDMYFKFFEYCLGKALTPIFEYVGPDNRIVLDYKEPALILLAVRSNIYGDYMDIPAVLIGSDCPIPNVEVINHDNVSHLGFIESMQTRQDIEGYVVMYRDKGKTNLVKMKTMWYVNLHRVKSRIAQPRNFVQAILSGTLDDVKACLDGPQLDMVNTSERLFWGNVSQLITTLKINVPAYQREKMTRKDYAISPYFKVEHTAQYRSLVFRTWDGEISAETAVMEMIEQNTMTNKSFEKVEQLLDMKETQWPNL